MASTLFNKIYDLDLADPNMMGSIMGSRILVRNNKYDILGNLTMKIVKYIDALVTYNILE